MKILFMYNIPFLNNLYILFLLNSNLDVNLFYVLYSISYLFLGVLVYIHFSKAWDLAKKRYWNLYCPSYW